MSATIQQGMLSDEAASDARVLRVRAERAAKVVQGTVASSPLWALFAVFVTAHVNLVLGEVPLTRGIALLALVVVSVIFGQLVLNAYYAERESADAQTVSAWLGKLLGLNTFFSVVWGFAPWLLWDSAHRVNHYFIVLLCLAVVTRFLVNRSNHVWFFLGSFVPMAVLLFVRCAIGFDSADLVLAIIVPLYALQVFWESNAISDRWDREAMLRFANEDMARELEEARDEALMKRAEAETANASKTAFLANMSHELRTPLNAILGFSEIISRECLGPVGSPRYKEYAGDIHNSGAHLLSLINDLLDVAKIEAGRMEIEPHMVETGRALENALKFVGERAREHNQNLSVTVAEDAAVLFADERALKQIVINLVSNSVKFTQDGGRIDVTAARNGDSDFELRVTDNGPGIPREKIDRIFKPFSRVDNRYDSDRSGTGLGLALVRGLAELHGGRAWIESELGRGTCVHVVLPGKAAAPPSQKRRA